MPSVCLEEEECHCLGHGAHCLTPVLLMEFQHVPSMQYGTPNLFPVHGTVKQELPASLH